MIEARTVSALAASIVSPGLEQSLARIREFVLEDAIIDPSERENFQITTLSDATQYKVIRPRTVSESLSPVGSRFSPSKAKSAFGAATVANVDAVAPLKPASIWSPIKKTASFDEIQSQYF